MITCGNKTHLSLAGDFNSDEYRFTNIGAAQDSGDAVRYDQVPPNFTWPQLVRTSDTTLIVRSVKGPLVPLPDASDSVAWLKTNGPAFGGANAFTINNASNAYALSANTFYFIYLYLDSGSLAAEFSTTAWEWGALGSPQKIGDGSRLCVGCVQTSESIEWPAKNNLINVFSFFNQTTLARQETVAVASGSATMEAPYTGSAIYLAIPYPMGVSFGGDGWFSPHVASTTFKTRMGIDGNGSGQNCSDTTSTGTGTVAFSNAVEIGAGWHSFVPLYVVDRGQSASAISSFWIRADGQY